MQSPDDVVTPAPLSFEALRAMDERMANPPKLTAAQRKEFARQEHEFARRERNRPTSVVTRGVAKIRKKMAQSDL